ncbi:MAG: CdaR family protein [Chloroflexota bacterium]
MTRLLGIIVHNWPLKLAAVGLATLLYGGLVFSQSQQTFPGVIPIEPRDLPRDAFLLTTIEPVTEVRYFSPSGIPPIESSFEAWVDLSSVEVGGGPVTVPVQVRAAGITVVGHTPEVVTVELDRVVTADVPVIVQYPPPPEGLQIGEISTDPSTVTVSGPASVVDKVTSVRADVVIQPSGISVDQDVLLVPVDAVGNAVAPVNLTPSSARIRIPVFENLRSKSLTVTPVITGTPAPGFEIASVTVEPLVVTVEGDAEQLAELARVDTVAISTNGASSDFTVQADLELPTGVQAVDAPQVTIKVAIRPVTATRTFQSGLRLTGVRPDRVYALSTDRVLLTLGGTTGDLDRLSGATLVAVLDVTGLDVGTVDVRVTIDLPAGVNLVSASPAEVTVTISVPVEIAPSAPPGSLASPSPSPGG